MKGLFLFICLAAAELHGQEAAGGLDLRATLSGMASNTDGGFRSILYPTWKIDSHWTVSGAIEVSMQPDVFGNFSAGGRKLETSILQANVGYSQFWENGSIMVRAGELTTAFGAYLLHYDDAENPMIDLPPQYGYYYTPVSTVGLAGVQVDITHRKWDARAQFVNSSPANPRSILDKDQYGNWAGGIGYTIRQGLRVGISAYQGPYLDRHFAYFFPGEANPNTLPAHAYGVDVQWSYRHWDLQAEAQSFEFPYRAIPTYRERTSYVEARRVLNPRWYVAARAGFTQNYAAVVGYRPAAHTLIKWGCEFEPNHRALTLQVVETIHPLSLARN